MNEIITKGPDVGRAKMAGHAEYINCLLTPESLEEKVQTCFKDTRTGWLAVPLCMLGEWSGHSICSCPAGPTHKVSL